MRCLACNKRLTEFEATVKYAESGKYVDLCDRDRAFLPGSIRFLVRADLQSTETDTDESTVEPEED